MKPIFFLMFLCGIAVGCGDELQKQSGDHLIIVDTSDSGDATVDTSDGGSCVPSSSCAAEGATCGELFDGCATRNCGHCAAGSECIDSKCVVEERLGTACESPSDCAGLGCLGPASSWRGGYCASPCTDDSTCGPNGACAINGAASPLCGLLCEVDQDCGRADYGCLPGLDGRKICQAAAVGSATVGDACTYAQDCSLHGGFCIRVSSFAGGYCSGSCAADSDCDAESHCAQGICYANGCSRPGYLEIDIDLDDRVECVPVGGQGSGLVGDECGDGRDCGGGDYGVCLGYSGGYCSIGCGPGEGTCGSDSICHAFSGVSQCLKICDAVTECRDGYNCVSVAGGKSACMAI